MLRGTVRSGSRSSAQAKKAGVQHIACWLTAGCAAFLVAFFSPSEGKAAQQASTSLTLSSSMNPSPFGQLVTFTASVLAKQGKPAGVVTFKEGNKTLGTGALNGSGQATFSTPLLVAGAHAISASYGGDANFAISTSAALRQIVKRTPTSTTLGASLGSWTFGQPMTFTASIFTKNPAPTAGPPTGMVTFKDGATVLGVVKLNMFQQAAFISSAVSAGRHAITASYEGGANFEPSTSAASSVAVIKATTSVTLTSSHSPATAKPSITLTATVNSETVTGAVRFFDGKTVLGTANLSKGKASISISPPATSTHSITAQYLGSTNFDGSISAPLTQGIR